MQHASCTYRVKDPKSFLHDKEPNEVKLQTLHRERKQKAKYYVTVVVKVKVKQQLPPPEVTVTVTAAAQVCREMLVSCERRWWGKQLKLVK